MYSFGEHLRQFSLAIDIVPGEVFDSVFEMTYEYLTKYPFGIHFAELVIPGIVNSKQGLVSKYHKGGSNWSSNLKDSEGKYIGQISLAFDKQTELWIVPENPGTLGADNQKYIDLLNNVKPEDIPDFTDLTHKPAKTSIMFPLSDGEKKLGILNLESAELLRPKRFLYEELRIIADALADLHALWSTRQNQLVRTQNAITKLRSLTNLKFLDSQRVFLAYSAKYEQDVLAVIKKVLDEYDVEVSDWKIDSSSGNINDHIWDNIVSSGIGICYFSEKSSESTDFIDNPNVLIEAGMIHALSQSSDKAVRGWIPIREKNSPPIPFDLSSLRFLEVPRLKNGDLQEDRFEGELHKRLTDLHLKKQE